MIRRLHCTLRGHHWRTVIINGRHFERCARCRHAYERLWPAGSVRLDGGARR